MAAQPFALLASRGGDCTVQDKMKTAIATGASALIIVDTLTSAYTPRNNDTASSLKLTDPCLVSCSKGRGLVDPKSLGVAGVLDGILGACPGPAADTGKGCPTSLCAFSGRAEGGLREVCCVLNPPAQVAPTSSASSSSAAVASDVNAGDGVEAGASIDSASLDSVLPTLYLSMSTGMALTQACKGSASAVGAADTLQRGPCTVLLGDGVPPSRFDGSMFLTWGLATFTAALAAYLAAHAMSDRGSSGGGDDGSGEGKGDGSEAYDDASATIDQSTAFGFLVIASGGLLTLYFLIQAGFNIVLVLLNAMFVLASGSAAAQILVTPCIVALLPPTTPLGAMRVTIPFSAAEVTGLAEEMPLTHLVGGLLAFGASLSWFFLRGSPWIWLLQDVLSVMICVLFVRTIRLPSLKVGGIFLGLMFCYDIFMVFISPVIFGKSIMLEVALAGRPTETVGADGACERSEGENMPMLMLLPRLAVTPPALAYTPPLSPGAVGVGGGALTPTAEPMPSSLLWWLSGASNEFGLIGLGDIVLPALALTFARRVDLAIAQAAAAHRHLHTDPPPGGSAAAVPSLLPCLGYFWWSVMGYGVGLGFTLAANAFEWTFNGVQGQPALLYLVPGVIGAISLRALLHGQFGDVWAGTHLPQTPADLGQLVCDGCRKTVRGEDLVYSDAGKNQDYCPSCHELLPTGRRAALVSNPVWKRCGLDPPRENGAPLL